MELTTPKEESRIPLTVPEFPTLIFQVILEISIIKMNVSSFRIQHVKNAASHCNGSQNSRFIQFKNANVDVSIFN